MQAGICLEGRRCLGTKFGAHVIWGLAVGFFHGSRLVCAQLVAASVFKFYQMIDWISYCHKTSGKDSPI